MYTVKIENEYLHGPIWVYTSNGIAVWKFPLIDDDSELKKLNHKAMEMFSAYYEFDSHGESVWFDHEKEKAEKRKMLNIIQRIISRLNEINDGSFVIQDFESARLKAL